LENLMLYGDRQPGETLWRAVARPPGVARRERELRERAFDVAARLSLAPLLNAPASDLSGGQKKLLELGRALMTEPRLILLDEPTGAGKSTLLQVVAGLLRPHRGRVRLRDAAIQGRPAREISALGVAFVPQEQNVFASMTVRENLEMGGYVDPKGSRRRIDEIFARFPALADKRRHAARTLSGGQRQMLAMAMALMVAPALLLLDEPSAG